MRGLNSETVDLVYLDPPFNSNRNYAAPIGSEAAGAAFKDTWTLSDVDLAWHGEIAEASPGGVYHHFSAKHLDRYVREFEGRHNARPLDTADQMATMAARAVGKHLPYETLIGPCETRQPAML